MGFKWSKARRVRLAHATGLSTTFLGLALLSAALSGCAGTAPAEPSGTPTQQTDPTATPSPTAAAFPIPDDIAGSFREIADASCSKASAEGVTEIAEDGSGRLILVPKEDAYQDFSAVSVGMSGVGELIWSTEEFYACNASIGFSYSDESNSEYGLIEFDPSDGSYTVTVGEGKDAFIAEYTVRDGLIRTGSSTSDGETTVLTIEYGMPAEADIDILRSAVDTFLAEEG
jgi:hypothetical protein